MEINEADSAGVAGLAVDEVKLRALQVRMNDAGDEVREDAVVAIKALSALAAEDIHIPGAVSEATRLPLLDGKIAVLPFVVQAELSDTPTARPEIRVYADALSATLATLGLALGGEWSDEVRRDVSEAILALRVSPVPSAALDLLGTSLSTAAQARAGRSRPSRRHGRPAGAEAPFPAA